MDDNKHRIEVELDLEIDAFIRAEAELLGITYDEMFNQILKRAMEANSDEQE